MLSVDALRESMGARAGGKVFVWSVAHARGDDAEAAVEDLLQASPPPLEVTSDTELEELEAVDTETVRRLLTHTLQFDLASHARVLDADQAARLAGNVIEALSGPVQWWTNGTLGLPGPRSTWTPLTPASFDTGVIGVSQERVLVVWFIDEDEDDDGDEEEVQSRSSSRSHRP